MLAQFAKSGNSVALPIPSAFAREIQATDGTCADLAELLAGMTNENVHGETDTGPAVGNEI